MHFSPVHIRGGMKSRPRSSMCCGLESTWPHEDSWPLPLGTSLPAPCLVHMLPARPCLAPQKEKAWVLRACS